MNIVLQSTFYSQRWYPGQFGGKAPRAAAAFDTRKKHKIINEAP